MGKNLIQQRRGKGSMTFRVHGFKFKGVAKYKKGGAAKGIVVDLIDCPGHTAPLAKIKYDDGEQILVQAAEWLRVGDVVETGESAEIKLGNTMSLKNIPEGTLVFNIESNVGDGGKFARSSGAFAKVLNHIANKTAVMLPSKKEKNFDSNCRATIGVVAGSGRTEKPFLKAGRRVWIMKVKNKFYPKVTGAAMNAADHPFGGKRTSRKGRPTIAPKNAPPGRKVGMLHPRRTGRKKR